MAEAIFVEDQKWHYLTNNLENKEVHHFPRVISSNENLIGRLGLELAKYDVAEPHVNRYATEIFPHLVFSDE